MSNYRRRRKAKGTILGNQGSGIGDGLPKEQSPHFYRPCVLLLALALTVASVVYYYTGALHVDRGVVATGLDEHSYEMFSVVELPGRGKGLIANRDIKQGELVIHERPLFVVPQTVSSSPAALISQSLNSLKPRDREVYLNLSYVNFPKGLDPEHHPEEVALAIFQTNAVSAGDGVGVFPRMARLNHGCSRAFNVVYSWRKEENALVVHALRPIRKGQELLTTYTDTKKPRRQRRVYLEGQYGFTCACSVCSLPDEESRASDKRLIEISEKYRRFATWGSRNINGGEALRLAQEIWNLEDEEGYWSERGQLAADAVWVAASHSDAASAHYWGQLAVQWYKYELGQDSQQVREMEGVLIAIESHQAWGSREGLHRGR